MRYLLDTNIVSNLARPAPSPPLVAWMEAQPDGALFISTITIAEIWRGVSAAPEGRKKYALQDWFSGPAGPMRCFQGRILAFDATAALQWGELMATGAAQGRPRPPIDMMIAAIALTQDCVLATNNEKDFSGVGVRLINPLI